MSQAQIDAFQELVRGTNFFGEWGPNGQFLEFDVSPATPRDDLPRRLRELLGEDGYRRYGEFNETTLARELTAQVSGRLFYSEAPLSPGQADQLVRLLAQTPRRRSEADTRYWDAVLAGAAGFLFPAQIEALASIRTMLRVDESVESVRAAVASSGDSSAK